MESPFAGKEIWFLTGSQDLYGPETLEQVTAQSQDVVALLDAAEIIPVSIVHRPTLKDRDAIRAEMLAANADPVLHRRDHLDAHLLPGQDVDPRPGRPGQADAAPAHAGVHGSALGHHRHGLHEPQPVRARRPRVRLHRLQARQGPPHRRRSRVHRTGAGEDRHLGARGRRLGLAPQHQAGPLRRQHAQRRRHRGRQDRGRAAARRLRQHLGRQRPGRGRQRRLRRGHRRPRGRVRGALRRRARAPQAAASGTSRCATARARSWGCSASWRQASFGAFTTNFEDLGGLQAAPRARRAAPDGRRLRLRRRGRLEDRHPRARWPRSWATASPAARRSWRTTATR